MKNPLLDNFRFVNESDDKPPYLEPYEIVEGHQLYKSTNKESLITLHDKQRNVFHTFDYEGMNPFNEKEIEAYVTKYNEENE